MLGPCIDSVLAQEVAGGFETIVLDNGSTDETPALLRGYGSRIRVSRSERNLGFPAGNNLAAREARGRILFFLNSDTELLRPDVLEQLAAAVEAREVGLAGPRLLNPDRTLQPSCAGHPGIVRALVLGTGLHRLLPARLLERVAPEFWAHDREADVDWLLGAALMIPAQLFRSLGGFWPHMYLEEADLAYRVQKAGLRVRFVPSAEVVHIGNHSFSQWLPDISRAERVARAELVFLATHYRRARALAIRALVAAGYGGRALVLRILGRGQRMALYRAMTKVYLGGARVSDAAPFGGPEHGSASAHGG